MSRKSLHATWWLLFLAACGEGSGSAFQDDPTSTEQGLSVSSTTPLAIPDNKVAGVISTLNVTEAASVTTAEVEVHIRHTYVGDLVVRLQCPAGNWVVLQNQQGGRAQNLDATFPAPGCVGQSARGPWRLEVSDRDARDVGTLDRWTLRLGVEGGGSTGGGAGGGSGGGSTGGGSGGGSAGNVSRDTPLDIPDNRTSGISSAIAVTTAGTVSALEVELHIEHPYVGDLLVKLVCPSGTEVVLKNHEGGSGDDIDQRLAVSDCNGQDAAGTYRLVVADTARSDVGVLRSWALQLRTGGAASLRVTGLERWYLIGNAVTQGDDAVRLQVAAPASVQAVQARIDGQNAGSLRAVSNGFEGALSLTGIGAGEHTVELFTDGSPTPAWRQTFQRTHPLYVLLTTDWDTADSPDNALRLQDALHAEHPELKMTHFLGPYTFTDPDITASRQRTVVNWLTNLRSAHGDEVGLHIHPYCNFVEAAGLRCKTSPSFSSSEPDTTGYTVNCDAYSEAEFSTMLQTADRLFVARGLGKPTSFRAGGWTADEGTLKALSANGYVADTSANNWARLEEWSGRPLYTWNRQHWTPIVDTSQPYHPSATSAVSAGNLAVLEVPDNGIMVDYVDGAEMVSIFNANWSGQPLTRATTFVIGLHPINYDSYYHARMQQVLSHADRFLASQHQGPVVYETLSRLARGPF